MRLVAKVKLLPTEEQHQLLYATLTTVNSACNQASEMAFSHGVFKQFDLNHLAYHTLKDDFNLSAQMVVRAIAKVAYAYKVGEKEEQYTFHKHGAIPYDDRILAYNIPHRQVSIWCMGGRQKMAFVCGERDYQLLQHQRGESDLCLIDGQFYLFAGCEIEIPDPMDVQDVIGADFGITTILADSDGNSYSSKNLNALRHRNRKLRQKLQKKGTRSAKRLLKKRRRKESRFAKDVNHCISKKLVVRAKDTHRGIALEDLKGIRERQTVRKAQRSTFASWSFDDLRQKVAYKAKLHGVPLYLVDPRYTSQACNECGTVDKRNRPSQSVFKCVSCGHCANADTNAALNIRSRAIFNLPYAPR